MTEREYLLIQLASEACEVAHRATKALHFGLGERQPGQELTNEQRLVDEIVDLIAVVDELTGRGELTPPVGFLQARQAKRDKVARYMEYARECGTLEPRR